MFESLGPYVLNKFSLLLGCLRSTSWCTHRLKFLFKNSLKGKMNIVAGVNSQADLDSIKKWGSHV